MSFCLYQKMESLEAFHIVVYCCICTDLAAVIGTTKYIPNVIRITELATESLEGDGKLTYRLDPKVKIECDSRIHSRQSGTKGHHPMQDSKCSRSDQHGPPVSFRKALTKGLR